MRSRLALIASVCAAALGAQAPQHSMLVSTAWLAQHLDDRSVVVLHITHDSMDYRMGHVPGARAIAYSEYTTMRDSIRTELPAPADLQRLFERLGVSDDSHVVIYASGTEMAPMASRLFLTLDYLGHPRVSLLNGGLVRWQAERRPISTETPVVSPGRLTPRPRAVSVDANFVSANAGKRGFAFIDTRTDPEYLGTGDRGGLRSDGHIQGARQLQWEQLFASADSGVFLESHALAKLYSDRVAAGDTVITYCLVGYRASMTYFGARMLGYPVRIYDGSYQDWSRRGLPVKKGAEP